MKVPIYERALANLEAEGLLSKDDRVFVACGGDSDARALHRCGMRNVLISNVDDRRSEGIGDYEWMHCDAEDLPLDDDSFDWGTVHAGLHHCSSPHRGLLELLRIARKGIVAVEARDSLIMNVAVKLGFTTNYEIEAVALDGGTGGGFRNGPVPNFIYRWTESEVRKTVESAYPDRITEFRFFYDITLPVERLTMLSAPKRALITAAGWGAKLAFKMFPKQGNQFAFAIIKTGLDKPWIARDQTGAHLDPHFDTGFEPSKYVKEVVEELT